MATILQTMTLGQQTKMFNLIQQSPQNNCVIVPNSMQKQTVIQQKRPIAPNPIERTSVLVNNNNINNNNNNNNNNDLRCKRKIQFMPYGAAPQQPASVARRNARERNRVKQVNNGFATLRQHIPANLTSAFSPQSSAGSTGGGRGASKKLSKVETLRLAVEYIRSLQQLIDEHENEINGNVKNENSDRFYSTSPDTLNQQYSSYPILLTTPSCSEASVSPTPSHSSEGSFSAASSYTNNLYQETYENYDPKSPVDEELLDVIFSWQQNE